MRQPVAKDRALLPAGVIVPQHVVYRDMPSEVVVLNLDTGRYHSLNRVAGRMLAACDAAGTVAEAAAALATEFGVAVERVEIDLCELCRQLAARGLIELDSRSAGPLAAGSATA